MARFLFRHLKGYRVLIVLAVGLTFAQVGASLLLAFPLKFILDKLVNHRDPHFPFAGPHVVMVDFDGFCLADPALDVAYLLAYLRPSGLWYQRPGMRDWFERAATEFVSAYRAAMRARGVAHTEIDGILERVRLYEAAFLVKIATRRIHHLNSPRPHELSAMLGAIAACLTGEAWRP